MAVIANLLLLGFMNVRDEDLVLAVFAADHCSAFAAMMAADPKCEGLEERQETGKQKMIISYEYFRLQHDCMYAKRMTYIQDILTDREGCTVLDYIQYIYNSRDIYIVYA